MESKLKHLEFIQGVVNRLASDSFRIKGWTVILVAALFVLLAREGRVDFMYIGLVPVFFFWGLDGYFLWQERLFRALYDQDKLHSDLVGRHTIEDTDVFLWRSRYRHHADHGCRLTEKGDCCNGA